MKCFPFSKLVRMGRFHCNDFQNRFHHLLQLNINKPKNIAKFSCNPIVSIFHGFYPSRFIEEQKKIIKERCKI